LLSIVADVAVGGRAGQADARSQSLGKIPFR
jgi:hypothetical protein